MSQVVNNVAQLPGKSPLLLQKKQQMMIQKTREPAGNLALHQNQQVAGSQLATANSIKPVSMVAAVNSVVAASNLKASMSKTGTKS